MRVSSKRIFVGDFETTVLENPIEQDFTEVWASGLVELNTENVLIDNCIEDTYDFLENELYFSDVVVYYHNLKFDGTFWLDFLIRKLGMKCATKIVHKTDGTVKTLMLNRSEMPANSFTCSVSAMGQFYSITIKIHNHFLELRDSLKLIPISVEDMGESYDTKHKKLKMEYESNDRHAHGKITPEEKEYLKNDLLVVKEVLEIMFAEGHDRLTIGSCCMHEFKSMFGRDEYKETFPDVTKIDVPFAVEIENPVTGQKRKDYRHADDFIRKSYHGGWCYVNPKYQNKLIGNGYTADVNSLYPFVMSSASGNVYPVGKPCFWEGSEIPRQATLNKNRYYFIKVRTRFKLKTGFLPTIQIKNDIHYKGTEWLNTSDIYNKKDGNYYSQYIDLDGNVREAIPELILTCTDWEMMKEHYELTDTEILGGCWFYAESGLFDEYINKYKKIKETSKGAIRQIAKLYLNNLYGKLAASKNSSFKIPKLDENGILKFESVLAEDKEAGYIPAGAAITSYARAYTIRAAQQNFNNFVYADTDSIHCIGNPCDVKGIKIHDNEFGCWKLETTWDKGEFVRQKTYIEHVVEKNLKTCKPYYNITCAGMPKQCKELFQISLKIKDEDLNKKEFIEKKYKKLTEDEKRFFENDYTLEDFTLGLVVPSKLLPRRVVGGIVLTPTTFQMR